MNRMPALEKLTRWSGLPVAVRHERAKLARVERA
jgi:hypothetical protein